MMRCRLSLDIGSIGNGGNVQVATKVNELPDIDMAAVTEAEPFTQATEFEPPKPPKVRNTNLRKDLQDTYTTVAMMVYPFDPMVGTVIADSAEKCANSWDELARNNPRVKRALESLMTTSTAASVFAAHMPIVVAVATKYVPSLRDAYEQTVQPETTTAEDTFT